MNSNINYERNKEYFRTYAKQKYDAKKDDEDFKKKNIEMNKIYYRNNIEKVKAYAKNYYAKKIHNNR